MTNKLPGLPFPTHETRITMKERWPTTVSVFTVWLILSFLSIWFQNWDKSHLLSPLYYTIIIDRSLITTPLSYKTRTCCNWCLLWLSPPCHSPCTFRQYGASTSSSKPSRIFYETPPSSPLVPFLASDSLSLASSAWHDLVVDPLLFLSIFLGLFFCDWILRKIWAFRLRCVSCIIVCSRMNE